MSLGLTTTQQKALDYINHAISANGCAPTLREICEYMGYSAVGSAQDLVNALRRKGAIATPDRQSARSIIPTERVVEDDFYSIPVLGAVPAGNPVEAIEDRVGELKVSYTSLPKPRPKGEKLFALKAKGLSMINAGIHDGDMLVVKQQDDAEAGEIVVARVNGDATVKRLMKDKRSGWYLKPENPSFKDMHAKDHTIEVIGKVIALQRVL